MAHLWQHLAHGKEVVLPLQNIKNGILQCPSSMSFFRIQDTRLRPTSGTLMSKRVLAVQGLLHRFLRHCNTMDSPHPPSYLRGGPQPADDIVDLNRNVSMENLRELQRYSEKLQFEATCVRLWANGIQDQIMDEQEKVQNWISGMTDEINRLRRVQPAWTQHLQSPESQQHPMSMTPASSSEQPPASSSAASTIPVKAAPAPKNASMVCAPRNAQFSNVKGADPWSEVWNKKQHR